MYQTHIETEYLVTATRLIDNVEMIFARRQNDETVEQLQKWKVDLEEAHDKSHPLFKDFRVVLRSTTTIVNDVEI